MKDFSTIHEPYSEALRADRNAYYSSKRATVMNTIRPICEAFGISPADYNYRVTVDPQTGWVDETLVVEGVELPCNMNSIYATVKTLVRHILHRIETGD